MANDVNFLQQGTNTADGNLHLNDESKIKEILAEQEKLQKLYNEVVNYIQQHPQMSTEELTKYQNQLKELSTYYQTNQEKLKTLGYSSVQVNKNVVIKNGAKRNISIKTIFIGCAGIIFVFMIGLISLFFYLIKNPTQFSGLGSLGITPAVAKGLLQGLTLTVMLVVLLLGVIIILINTYKAFTEKNKPKGWYYSGIVVGILLLGLGLGAGTKVLGEIAKIDVESLTNVDEVVIFSMNTVTKNSNGKYKPSTLKIDGSFPLIAPVNINSQLLSANYKKFINLQLGNQKIYGLQLDCGNGQLSNYSGKDSFEKPCFYTKKGAYEVKLVVHYVDSEKKEATRSILLKKLQIYSDITIEGVDKKLNYSNNELVIGPLPTELHFNADQVFRDFNLANYHILRDGNGDGIEDKLDDTNFNFTYDTAGVFYPTISFPDINKNILYTFPLRIEKSSTPICTINLEQKKVNNYQVITSFYDNGERFIHDYSYIFYDKSTGKSIDEVHNQGGGLNFDYIFPGKGSYIIKMNFVTIDGKRGSCEKEFVLSEKSAFNYEYEFFASSPRKTQFVALDTQAIIKNKIINIVEVPTKLKLKLGKIEPKTNNTAINVYLDGQYVVNTSENEYLFDIRDSHEHKVKILIEDKVRGLISEENFTTAISMDDIIAELKILGEHIGYDPVEVTLDTSSSKLNDPEDQITYFSWDFGDGQLQNKISNAILQHKYHFNYKENNGTYTPKVTIYTQKGRSITATADKTITVKKQLIKLTITSTSHPTQESKVGEAVVFSLDFNGLPKKVSRDFGDNEYPLECEGRTCTEMTKTFSKKGTYHIKVKMDFEDHQAIEQTLAFKVR